MKGVLSALMTVLLGSCAWAGFDGSRWNVSTGNLSVSYIQASPIGAFPRAGMLEAPPSVESLKKLKDMGLVAYEDYVAWGAIERSEGRWDWTQHDAVCQALRAAGLHYVVYNWTHFPPVWLRESGRCTLMRCLEHGQDTNYLSIFDPRTVDYYDRFYAELAAHFGERIDGVYACILGPYGEGNYPLYVPDWVNMGHCHEGYWCADKHGLAAFREAMRRQYGDIASVNGAWATTFRSFSEIRPPECIAEGFKPSPAAFPTAGARRQWVDFIAWYHQAIIDFAEKSIQVTLKHFPKEKVRTKPGGNAGGVNPIAWGTYCPGYAKTAAKYGIVLQPADCHGAYFGDKWVGTAYRFYGVPLSTEPAGGLGKEQFVQRMFSDASCGASQLFTYEFEQHAAEIQKYAHLVTGRPGDTQIAVLCPTTLYRLGGDLGPTIRGASALRDVADYDVLDELLIRDGALTKRYRALVALQADFVEQDILDAVQSWIREGGTLIIAGNTPVCNVRGDVWNPAQGRGRILRTTGWKEGREGVEMLQSLLAGFRGTDGALDGVWTTRRGKQTFALNTTDKPVRLPLSGLGSLLVPAHEIAWTSR